MSHPNSCPDLIPDHYLPDLPQTQRCRCALPSVSATEKTNLDDESAFYRALLQPYTPTRLDKSQPSTSSDLARELENGMIDYREDHRKLARMARHMQDEARRAVVKQPRPDVIANLTLYQPKGQWAWIREVPLDESEDEIFVSRHEGPDSYKLRIKVARASDVRITYLSKLLIEGPQKWTGFWAEAALFKTLLQPFHNHLVPAMIGIYNTYRGIQFVFDVPHHSFWVQASPDMPDILKRRCLETYRKLHEQGVLHGSVDLANILIGGDGNVKLINFHQARATLAMPYVHLKQATPEEFALEMREVLYKLDYKNARFQEHQNWRDRYRYKRSRSKDRGKGKTKETPPNSDPFDVPLDPPIDPGPDGYNWIVSKDWQPERFVVPGQSQEQFHAHVKLFLSSLQGVEFEEAEAPKPDLSVEPGCPPSRPATIEPASPPTHSTTTEHPTEDHHNLCKRPLESPSEDKSPPTKKPKIVDFFPLVTSRDGTLDALKPPPTGPYNPKAFRRRSQRKVREEPEVADLTGPESNMSTDNSDTSSTASNSVPKHDPSIPSSKAASSRASSPGASTSCTSSMKSQPRRQNEPISQQDVRELQMKLHLFLKGLPSQKRWRRRKHLLNQGGAAGALQEINGIGSGTANINNGTDLQNSRKRKRNENDAEAALESPETRPPKKLRRSETLILISGPDLPCTRKAVQVLVEGERERGMGEEILVHRPSPVSSPEPALDSSPQAVRMSFSPQLFNCADEDLETFLDGAIHAGMEAAKYDFDMEDAEDFLFGFMSEEAATELKVVNGERDNQRELEVSGCSQEAGSHKHAENAIDNLHRHSLGAGADGHKDHRHHTKASDYNPKGTVCKDEDADIQLKWDSASEKSRASNLSNYNDVLAEHDSRIDEADYLPEDNPKLGYVDDLLEYGINPADSNGLPMTSMQKFIAIASAMQESRAEERRIERELLAAEPGASVLTTLGSMVFDRISTVSNAFRSLLPSNQL